MPRHPAKKVPTLIKILMIVAPLLCLAIPSIWLLMTVPPLWRNSDAYHQRTAPPSTILLHGPLYCAAARLPLWLGYLATVGGRGAISFGDFMMHPRLTDAGIYALLWTQHVGLWIGLFYLIAAVSTSLITRTGLRFRNATYLWLWDFLSFRGWELVLLSFVILLGLLLTESAAIRRAEPIP